MKPLWRNIIFATLLATVGIIIYARWPTDTHKIFSGEIKQLGLKLTIKEYYKRSGKYLKISGRFEGNDTTYEYVLYSRPFALGPSPNQRPVKKISIKQNAIMEENYYLLATPTDSLTGTEPITEPDKLLFAATDSILRKSKSFYPTYLRSYQNILHYTKMSFSETDEGLFIETIR